MNYLDPNFATALHFNIRTQTDVAERYVRKSPLPFIFSELAELECRRAFISRTQKADSENWMRLQSLLAEGIWQRESLPVKTVFQKAAGIIDQYGSKIRSGTLDTLHVAHALISGCTWFLSFDSQSNARVLATVCRLRVFPELSAEEKRRVSRSH